MKNLNRHISGIMILLLSLSLSACQPIQPIEKVAGVPEAVRDLEGTYVGSWALFGIDEESNVVQLASWTDTITAENAQIDDEQAFVLTTSEMIFDGSGAPPVNFTGKEGYFLMPDGSLGDYFTESFGQISKSTQVGENVWISVAPASAEDLASYRLPGDASGQHVLVKVVTSEAGTEMHRITRVTTVNWTDQAGQDRSTQFVSIEGFHERQSE